MFEYMKMKGLRFRLTGEEERADDTLWKRHQYWKERQEKIATASANETAPSANKASPS